MFLLFFLFPMTGAGSVPKNADVDLSQQGHSWGLEQLQKRWSQYSSGLRADICGDKDGCTSLPPNAISGAAGLILASSPFAGEGGSQSPLPHQDWLHKLVSGLQVTLAGWHCSLLCCFPKGSPWQPLLVHLQTTRFSLPSFPQLQCFARPKLHPQAGSFDGSPMSCQ